MKVRLSAIQCRLGDMKSAERVVRRAVENGAEAVLLPEYFSYSDPSEISEMSDIAIRFLKRISSEYGVIACGNAVVKDGGYFNRAFLYDRGELVGVQDKMHPTRNERAMGIECGREFRTFDVGFRIAILVCADILYPEICRVAGLRKVDVVMNPVVSFKKSELPGTEYRYCLYFTRSFDNCYAIVKAGGFGRTFTGSEAVGRSLIATFDGILARSSNEEVEEDVTAEVDLDRMKKCREVNYSLHDRNTGVYRDLAD